MSGGLLPKTCESCGMGFLRQIPLSAKIGEKYCPECKPVMARLGQPLADYSKLRDPINANQSLPSEVNREWGTDLSRRQIRQLAWATGMKELAK